jgi:hypothetical protein
MVAFKINFDLKINEANETLKNTEFFSENTVAEKRQLDDEYNKLQVCTLFINKLIFMRILNTYK